MSRASGNGLIISEQVLLSSLDNINEGCQIINFDWEYIYVNASVVQQGKSSRDELLGKKMWEVYPGIEQTSMFAVLKECMESRNSAKLENEFSYPDGTQGWFELNVQPVPDGIVVLSSDISDKKRSEQLMKNKMANIAALRTIDLAIAGSLDLGLILQTALEQVLSRLGGVATSVLLYSTEMQQFEIASVRGFSDAVVPSRDLRAGIGSLTEAVLSQKTCYYESVEQVPPESNRRHLMVKEKFVSYAVAPIVAKGEVLGVLELFEKIPATHDDEWFHFFEMLAGQIAIGVDSVKLFQGLKKANLELTSAYGTTIEGWSRALDLRDKETEGHTQRVTQMTLQLARSMRYPERELLAMRHGALLHDIGKMGVPDNILLKPGPLTGEEWVVMKQHPILAFLLLQPIDYLRPSLDIPHYHHEKWDGSGYPDGLKGKNIPLAARIFAIADVWDALRSDRPYREHWELSKVREHIEQESGKHFDPDIVPHFIELTKNGDESFR